MQRQLAGVDAAAALKTWVSEVLGLDASLLQPPRPQSFAAEAWLVDSEGNRLSLLVWLFSSAHTLCEEA